MSRSEAKPRACASRVSEKGNQPPTKPCAGPTRLALTHAVAVTAGIVVGALGTWGYALYSGKVTNTDAAKRPTAPSSIPASHYALLAMSSEQLGRVDIAVMNLLCAKGLPGGENLDIPAALRKLDEWAAKVKFETERHLYRVTDPRYADHYEHSEARLRAEFIVQVLQDDCGVRYDHARVNDPDFRDSGDMFLHGMLPGGNGGTCASLPVLYVAIGRRLGYPMKLVLAREHVFCRWDDGKERVNIEGAGDGVSFFPDEHYRTSPRRLTDEMMASGEFLKSLSPTEELAAFVFDRGTCLHANGRVPEAIAAYAEAHRLVPGAFTPRASLEMTLAGVAFGGGVEAPPSSRARMPGQARIPNPRVYPGLPHSPGRPGVQPLAPQAGEPANPTPNAPGQPGSRTEQNGR